MMPMPSENKPLHPKTSWPRGKEDMKSREQVAHLFLLDSILDDTYKEIYTVQLTGDFVTPDGSSKE